MVTFIRNETDELEAACPLCGENKQGVRNCCSNGGSWEGSCTSTLSAGGAHTWTEGFAACQDSDTHRAVHATANWDPAAAEVSAAEATKVLKVTPPDRGCDPEGDEPCGTETTHGAHMDTQFRSALPAGGDPRSCVARDDASVADDEWCITNCGFSPPNCPPTLCRCGAATHEPDGSTASPTLAPPGLGESQRPLRPANSSALQRVNSSEPLPRDASKNLSAVKPKVGTEANATAPAPRANTTQAKAKAPMPLTKGGQAPVPPTKAPAKKNVDVVRAGQPAPAAVL